VSVTRACRSWVRGMSIGSRPNLVRLVNPKACGPPWIFRFSRGTYAIGGSGCPSGQ
jgi:hypothetical protein